MIKTPCPGPGVPLIQKIFMMAAAAYISYSHTDKSEN